MDFNSLAKMTIEAGANRFHVVSGTVPVLHFPHRTERLSLPKMNPPEVYSVVSDILDEAGKKRLFDRSEILLRRDYSAEISFRIHIFKQRGTLGFSAKKILNRIMEPEEVPVFPAVLELLKSRRGGLLLVSGLSDSGRSSTENSLLHFFASQGSRHIVQLADCLEGNFPVYDHSFISRRIYGADLPGKAEDVVAIGLEDFDVISLGELDKPDRLETALLFAADGVFVIGTMLAPDIETAIKKIQSNIHNKPDLRTRFSESLIGIINQRFVLPVNKSPVFVSETLCSNAVVRKHLLENNHYALQNYLKTTNRDDCVSYEKAFKSLVANGVLSEEDLSQRFFHVSVV
jgi:twitching motility protein PilT